MSYLREGVSGEPVKLLQTKLGVAADGSFGPATLAALKAFQTKHGLSVDGVAGPDTFMSLGLPELVLLAQGTHGETVKKLQQALGLPADGDFGPATAKAVSAFQASHGLDVDGMAGPDTLAKMTAFAGEISHEQVAASVAPAAPAAAETTVASAAPAEHAPATLPSIAPGAPAQKAPAKSVWSTIRGWL